MDYYVSKGQTALKILADTETVITGSALYMDYVSPSGITGRLNAVINGTTIVEYNFALSPVLLLEVGTWIFSPYVVFVDGRSANGKPFKIIVSDPGNL